ncbi:Phosphoribosylaminoimidazole carboxylase pure domain-containing protein [Pelagophyceae sp. CCMP2097]|nr:Phosphoribosylaminoimidazole carboxylase pure domain-containing protein [Pelagophyceae sp. CCMP2097]
MARVGVIMGSDSDLPVMKAACEMLEDFGIEYECTIVSAHRTPARLVEYATTAQQRGLCVVIAGAGGAAHLPGMVAAMTTLPVVGVPVKTSALSGVDSLHSIVQMPKGVPVATVAIGNAANAALLAVRILACCGDAELTLKLAQFAEREQDSVLAKAETLEAQGWRTCASCEPRRKAPF